MPNVAAVGTVLLSAVLAVVGWLVVQNVASIQEDVEANRMKLEQIDLLLRGEQIKHAPVYQRLDALERRVERLEGALP